jgi:hypothetical protein
MELAKPQAAADDRVSHDAAIGPVIGLALSTLPTEESPGPVAFYNASRPAVNPFRFAGVMGRFDIATKTEHSQVALSAPRETTE